MDSSGGGCCIARYNNNNNIIVGSGGGYAYDTSKVNRILLSYRPIAPKPASGGSTFKGELEESVVKGGRRGRRKAVKKEYSNNKERKNNKNPTRKRKVPGNHSPPLVTLQLLPDPDTPETSFSDKNKNIGNSNNGYGGERGNNGEVLHMFDDKQTDIIRQIVTYNQDCMMKTVVIRSLVKVESLAYTWLAVPGWLGYTDDEKVMGLEQDTCPGFISDGANRVSWVNRAYKEMFGGGGEVEVVVWLVLGDGMEIGGLNCGGFTCRVRVVTCREGLLGKNNNGSSMILPCDVWKMDFGGFAWRFDTKAALSLSTTI